ncbi:MULTISPECIES: hypothetical protein [unclassified Moorena]|uniref:hypothetical protein n=1 Tax=unclassified Moorena TaxID=2683338 RepID=UPI0013FF382F|nr:MULTISPECIES: hypothetical protein [unclassified Moorena]NEO11574.1 hypothetical protein [Moorena sp. SIO3E8]NEP99704.1 hypothetical protein [Moorena sp. SIO3F7]
MVTNSKQSAFSNQLSAISFQQSAFSNQLSAISFQFSVFSFQLMRYAHATRTAIGSKPG